MRGGLDLLHEPVEPLEQRAGPTPEPRRARTALRSWPIALAAPSPRPTTSPTTNASSVAGATKVSYQSPPTSSISTPGR